MKEHILKQITEEIDKLKRELEVDLPSEIGKAREHGDLKENAEYHAAKERQLFVRSRLEQLLTRARELSVIDFSRIPKDKIGLGSSVKLLEFKTNKEIVYKLVLAEDADISKGTISVSSPIGRAIVNRSAGDEVEVKAPGGSREFEIVEFKTIYDLMEKKVKA